MICAPHEYSNSDVSNNNDGDRSFMKMTVIVSNQLFVYRMFIAQGDDIYGVALV